MTAAPEEDSVLKSGKELYSRGQFEDAVETFARAGDDPEALKSKATALLALNKFDEALACYDQIVELNPKEPTAFTDKAMFLNGMERYPDAIATYDQALELAPDSARIHRDKALALRLAGDLDGALKSYERALELDKNDSDTWAGKADLLIELGRHDEAIECLECASNSSDGRFGAFDWRTRGDRLALANNYEAAIHCFDRAIEGDIGDALAFVGKAQALLSMENVDLDGALKCFDRAIEIEPDDYYKYFLKANALATKDRFKEAIEFYDEALERNAKDKYSWANRGVCFENLKAPESALEAYSKAIEADPKYAFAWEGTGSCLNKLARYQEASSAFQRALTFDPDLFWANNDLGRLLAVYLGQPETALTHLDKAIEIDPEEAIPYVNKANTLADIDRVASAVDILESARERVKKPGVILQALANITFDRLLEPDRALKYLREAERVGYSGPELPLALCEVFVCLGHQEEARKQIGRWEKLEGEDPESLQNRCVASFFRFASYAIGDGLSMAHPYFETFIKCLQACTPQFADTPPIPPNAWQFDGFCAAIAKQPLELLTRITILLCVDIQRGKLAAPSLELLDLQVPVAIPVNDARPSTAGKVELHPSWAEEIIDAAMDWVHKKLDKL